MYLSITPSTPIDLASFARPLHAGCMGKRRTCLESSIRLMHQPLIRHHVVSCLCAFAVSWAEYFVRHITRHTFCTASVISGFNNFLFDRVAACKSGGSPGLPVATSPVANPHCPRVPNLRSQNSQVRQLRACIMCAEPMACTNLPYTMHTQA